MVTIIPSRFSENMNVKMQPSLQILEVIFKAESVAQSVVWEVAASTDRDAKFLEPLPMSR